MKLYRKKLSSIEELKREKIRLRYERRFTKASDLNPLAESGRSKVSASAKEGVMGSVMEMFSAKSDWQLALALAKPALKMLRSRRKTKQALFEDWEEARKGVRKAKQKPSLLKKLVVEIAVGYAAGKALLMTVQGVRLLIRRRNAAKTKAKLGLSRTKSFT